VRQQRIATLAFREVLVKCRERPEEVHPFQQIARDLPGFVQLGGLIEFASGRGPQASSTMRGTPWSATSAKVATSLTAPK
jgi:hypothetical protein